MIASSFPLDLPSGYDRTVIEGDALPGWEAELYRNDALLDYQVIPGQGQYRFINVPLLFGTNILRVELYGPQGQRREVVKRLYVGPGAAAPGQGYWRFSLSDANQTLFNMNQNNSQLFGFANEPRSGPVGSAEYLYGMPGASMRKRIGFNDKRRDKPAAWRVSEPFSAAVTGRDCALPDADGNGFAGEPLLFKVTNLPLFRRHDAAHFVR